MSRDWSATRSKLDTFFTSLQRTTMPKDPALKLSKRRERPHVCNFEGCKKTFSQKGNLTQHGATHRDERHTCDFQDCTKTFARKEYLAKHISEIHSLNENKRFVCTVCSWAFRRNEQLTKHIRTHTGERPYACNACVKSFARASDLTVHTRIHTGQRPYACDVENCEMKFPSSGDLGKHKRTHTDIWPFACDFETCEGKFRTSQDYKEHFRRVHSNERTFACEFDDCSKAFFDKKDLIVHYRKHTLEKPYKCTFDGCKVATSTSGSLVSHMRTHTREKPYTCNWVDCGKSFATASQLTTHVRFHTGEKPYLCTMDGCDKACFTSGHLKDHIYVYHTREGQVRLKKEEARILRLLQKHDFSFKEQHMIDFSCIGQDRDGSRCYIDFLLEIKDNENKTKGIIFLEIDEHQHLFSNYPVSCEIRRMSDVHRTVTLEGNALPIAFIRYNPDKMKIDGDPIKYLKRDREAKLVEALKNWQFDQPFGVYYMFYDQIDNEPEIFLDPDYRESFKQYYLGCV